MEYTYYDCLYGTAQIQIKTDFWVKTIRHPLMNRLKEIKQVGNLSFEHLNSTQTRFAHSLGTGYAISKILPPNIDVITYQKVIFAGLCHDLGHGPFSHSFEHFILPKLGINNWKHETYSNLFAKKIYDSIENPLFDFKHFETILEKGTTDGTNDVFQLVSSKTTGFDADRYDYMKRDAFLAGITLNVNWDRLTSGIKFLPEVHGKKYCQVFDRQSVFELSKFLTARFDMFQNFYHSTKTLGAELLIADIFVEADRLCDFSKKIYDIDYFSNCDDSILREFKTYRKKSKILDGLFNRIEKQEFYDFVDEIIFDCQKFDSLNKIERKECCQKIINEISELKTGMASNFTDCVDFSLVEADSHKDVNLDKSYFQNENGKIETIADDFELKNLFKRQTSYRLKIYVKKKNQREDLLNAIEKWKKKFRKDGYFK